MLEKNKIYQGDCLEVMKKIDDGSIDMILCDLPYNTTGNKWDISINLEYLWQQYKRIIKQKGIIILFGNEIFSNALINSNKKMFRYKWYWNKTRGINFQNARFMPMKCIEEINIFYKNTPIYNPQYWYSTPYKTTARSRKNIIQGISGGNAPKICSATISDDGRRYPLTLLTFKKDRCNYHQSQKPVDLLEYLIKTYTNENDLVLDNCIGSGTTAVACINTNRDYIGIELRQEYVDIANKRINELKHI